MRERERDNEATKGAIEKHRDRDRDNDNRVKDKDNPGLETAMTKVQGGERGRVAMLTSLKTLSKINWQVQNVNNFADYIFRNQTI